MPDNGGKGVKQDGMAEGRFGARGFRGGEDRGGKVEPPRVEPILRFGDLPRSRLSIIDKCGMLGDGLIVGRGLFSGD